MPKWSNYKSKKQDLTPLTLDPLTHFITFKVKILNEERLNENTYHFTINLEY